jgi:hypothetical protein
VLLVVDTLSWLLLVSVSCSPTRFGVTSMGLVLAAPPPIPILLTVKRSEVNKALIPLVGSLECLEGGE